VKGTAEIISVLRRLQKSRRRNSADLTS